MHTGDLLCVAGDKPTPLLTATHHASASPPLVFLGPKNCALYSDGCNLFSCNEDGSLAKQTKKLCLATGTPLMRCYPHAGEGGHNTAQATEAAQHSTEDRAGRRRAARWQAAGSNVAGMTNADERCVLLCLLSSESASSGAC